MATILAAFSFLFANVPCIYFKYDENDDGLSWRIMLATQEEHDSARDEQRLNQVQSWGKPLQPAFRMSLFDDDEGWSDKNPAVDAEGNTVPHLTRYANEPKTRKRNPVIAAFEKENGRLPTVGDTFTVKGTGDLFAPTTFAPRGDRSATGKYGANMPDILTKEQWDAIPEAQQKRQNCVFDLVHVTKVVIEPTAEEPEVMEDTPQPAKRHERW